MLDLVEEVEGTGSEQLLLLLADGVGVCVFGGEEVFESGEEKDQQFVLLLELRDESQQLLCEVGSLRHLC